MVKNCATPIRHAQAIEVPEDLLSKVERSTRNEKRRNTDANVPPVRGDCMGDTPNVQARKAIPAAVKGNKADGVVLVIWQCPGSPAPTTISTVMSRSPAVCISLELVFDSTSLIAGTTKVAIISP